MKIPSLPKTTEPVSDQELRRKMPYVDDALFERDLSFLNRHLNGIILHSVVDYKNNPEYDFQIYTNRFVPQYLQTLTSDELKQIIDGISSVTDIPLVLEDVSHNDYTKMISRITRANIAGITTDRFALYATSVVLEYLLEWYRRNEPGCELYNMFVVTFDEKKECLMLDKFYIGAPQKTKSIQ